LLTAVGTTEYGRQSAAPFKNLVTHGFVLDEGGKKMSKSLGNVISPTTIIAGGEVRAPPVLHTHLHSLNYYAILKDLKKEPAYGVDVLRLWAAGVDYTKDVSVGHTSLAQVAEAVRKLRNTARFMLGNLGDDQRSSTMLSDIKDHMSLVRCFVQTLPGDICSHESQLDRYVMHELYELETKTRESYENFNIHLGMPVIFT